MTKQPYFSEADVGTVMTELMTKIDSVSLLKLGPKEVGLRAAHALNAVRIMQDRLGIAPEALRFVYTDQRIVPEPLYRFMDDYLEGRLPQARATEVLDELQRDMRQYCFQHHIPATDPNTLSKSAMPLFRMIPGYAENTERRLKETLGNIVSRYMPANEVSATVNELYSAAIDRMDSIALDRLAHSVAELALPKGYLELMVHIGVREPTPEELAAVYWDAFGILSKELGVQPPLDRDQVLEIRLRKEIVDHERVRYRKSLDDLSL